MCVKNLKPRIMCN